MANVQNIREVGSEILNEIDSKNEKVQVGFSLLSETIIFIF